jgi:uncharacterized protein (DUF433 family)
MAVAEPVTNSHIVVDEHGVPWIEGVNTKVIEVAQDRIFLGWGADDIHEQHPHLSLAQIYAALSYYYDHKKELDADIERRHQFVERMRKEAGESPLVARLRASGKLP